MTRAVHWFRNDLRLRDNTALAACAARADAWLPVFVLDDHLLGHAHTGAPRVRFMLDCLTRLAADLDARGSQLLVLRGDPVAVIPRLLEEVRADLLSFNADTTPYARRRDAAVAAAAGRQGVRVIQTKDRVVFDASELRTQSGGAYTVYTPYQKKWYTRLREDPLLPRNAVRLPTPVKGPKGEAIPSIEKLGFPGNTARLPTGGERAARRRLRRFLEEAVGDYARLRDRPDVDGTSRLSPYLRFGAISVRQCVAAAREAGRAERKLAPGARKWVDELVWREFYAGILEENPRVLREPYRSEYADIVWNDDEAGFRAWCEGRTGYPIVDAGMRQLAETGWVHNRVRMVVASFLAKDLLIDWRHGERFFFQHLVDGDPASNNGGWQWSASTGTDAQPYFRIFNPVSQGERFDPEGSYVRRHLPELAGVESRFVQRPWQAPQPPPDYPPPVVSHAERRILALQRYKDARARGGPR